MRRMLPFWNQKRDDPSVLTYSADPYLSESTSKYISYKIVGKSQANLVQRFRHIYLICREPILAGSVFKSWGPNQLVNMVDWKYSSFFSLEVWRWHNLPATKFLGSPGIGSGIQCGRTERFDGCSGLYMHHPKPVAVSLRSQSISLGASGANPQSWNGYWSG